MVSDLNPENSSLITVNVDEEGKHFLTLDYSTYAWSAENIYLITLLVNLMQMLI